MQPTALDGPAATRVSFSVLFCPVQPPTLLGRGDFKIHTQQTDGPIVWQTIRETCAYDAIPGRCLRAAAAGKCPGHRPCSCLMIALSASLFSSVKWEQERAGSQGQEGLWIKEVKKRKQRSEHGHVAGDQRSRGWDFGMLVTNLSNSSRIHKANLPLWSPQDLSYRGLGWGG